MHLTRISQQQPETLEEFYTDLGIDTDTYMQQSAQMMLPLLHELRTDDHTFPVWASTAHHNLLLGRMDGTGRVHVSAWRAEYRITYDLPPDQALWRNACVVGETRDVMEAKEMIIAALVHDVGSNMPLYPPARRDM